MGNNNGRISGLEDLRVKKEALKKELAPIKQWVTVCGGTGCQAYGCTKVSEAIKEEIKARGLDTYIKVRVTGCHGFCERGPLAVFSPSGIFYQKIEPKDAKAIVEETLINQRVIERLLYKDPISKDKITSEKEVPFYKNQKRLIFGMNGQIDPTRIENYIANEGYEALGLALSESSPENVIAEIKKAGLRGRGGAGFPTGVKWEFCRASSGDLKYLICNCDEGDPGAYMDRSLLEGNPHQVLEGMIIGAYAVSASKGYIYVRAEYPLAVLNASIAIEQARQFGLLGNNILGSGFSFDIEICKGAGAFVSGEETALIAAIEGRSPEPEVRPPYPVESGLYQKPTNINNVETWANVPWIMRNGAEAFAAIGTEKSKGTKIFSLVGKINNTGLVEVPMGMTLRKIIYDMGGGIPANREFKAVQTGGPSGGCIPKELLDLPIDYESLQEAGSMMGSGGMIVMDENTCMVDVARYFLDFLKGESCGKCTSCREGIIAMHEILVRITEGRAEEGELDLLNEIAQAVKKGSLCGLGTTSPQPVLSTLRYFREEYEAHIRDKKCPGGVCKELIQYRIDPDKCTGCMVCARNCSVSAISGEKKLVHTIDLNLCIKCGACREDCKFDAVIIE
jgi:NADH:ubiquinone oxidoreductase subunit F (NADH-binding)/(2Fe-2S) ferredoxin/NAD-dependent dihydropyrimidine dehydrogenase PreA subunit